MKIFIARSKTCNTPGLFKPDLEYIWCAYKTAHCTSVLSSLRCCCLLQLLVTALCSQLMQLQQGWGTDHMAAPHPLSWKDIKLP